MYFYNKKIVEIKFLIIRVRDLSAFFYLCHNHNSSIVILEFSVGLEVLEFKRQMMCLYKK